MLQRIILFNICSLIIFSTYIGEYIRLPLEDLLSSLEFEELINDTIPIDEVNKQYLM